MHRRRARVDPRHQGGEGVAGTPGVVTPRCSATRIHCMLLCGMDRHVIQAQCPHHYHHLHLFDQPIYDSSLFPTPQLECATTWPWCHFSFPGVSRQYFARGANQNEGLGGGVCRWVEAGGEGRKHKLNEQEIEGRGMEKLHTSSHFGAQHFRKVRGSPDYRLTNCSLVVDSWQTLNFHVV